MTRDGKKGEGSKEKGVDIGGTMGRPMMQLEFSEAVRESLHYERFHHSHPRVRLKMEIVFLKSEGLPHPEIARLTRVCENTVRSCLEEYRDGGVEKLKEVRF